jgi:hypothetical protein
MGLVDSATFESEIGTSDKKDIKIEDMKPRGRGEDNTEVPESLRKIIGETALIDNNDEAKALARQFGISDSSVSAYKNGATSTASYNQPSKELDSHLNNVKVQISDKAKSRLFSAIDALTDDKLGAAKPRDLASIAKDMSAVVKNMESDKSSGTNSPTFVIFAPKMRAEESYDVIQVSE